MFSHYIFNNLYLSEIENATLLSGTRCHLENPPHWILCTFLTCFFRWPDCVKCLGQCGQACGFSPVWIYLCLFMLLKSKNPFPQYGHQCLFSPLCHLKCTFRSTLLVNFFSQRLQWNGFSPVWIRMWASTSSFVKHPLLQI